jgi:hypothetical protein
MTRTPLEKSFPIIEGKMEIRMIIIEKMIEAVVTAIVISFNSRMLA